MKLSNKFKSKVFRDSWVETHVKRGLAVQLRNLRGEQSQKDFGVKIGKPQNVVSRLEDPNYGSMSVQTLLDIASKIDVGLIVKFVPFGRILKETTNITEQDMAPLTYAQEVGGSGLVQSLPASGVSIVRQVERRTEPRTSSTAFLAGVPQSTDYASASQND